MLFQKKTGEPGTYQLKSTEIKVDTSKNQLIFLHAAETIGELECGNMYSLIYDLLKFWESPPNIYIGTPQQRPFPSHGFMVAFIRDAGEMLKNPNFAEPDVRITIGNALLFVVQEKNLVKVHLEPYYHIAQSTFQLSQSVEGMPDEVYYAHNIDFVGNVMSIGSKK